MLEDFRVACAFWGSRKYRRLERQAGEHGVLCLLRLWSYARQARPDGVLSNLTHEDIADEAKWAGDGDFAQVLVDTEWLDADHPSGWLYIHDWEEHNPYSARTPQRKATAAEAGAIGGSKRWEGTTPEERSAAMRALRLRADQANSDDEALRQNDEARNEATAKNDEATHVALRGRRSSIPSHPIPTHTNPPKSASGTSDPSAHTSNDAGAAQVSEVRNIALGGEEQRAEAISEAVAVIADPLGAMPIAGLYDRAAEAGKLGLFSGAVAAVATAAPSSRLKTFTTMVESGLNNAKGRRRNGMKAIGPLLGSMPP